VIERIKDAASMAVLWVGIAVFIGGLGYVVLQHLS
jgi:diacylglycerol kinase